MNNDAGSLNITSDTIQFGCLILSVDVTCCCRFGPIEYKGPFVAPYMESFILRVITPLTYLPSRARLKEFLSYHEVSFVFRSADAELAGKSVLMMQVANISFEKDLKFCLLEL